MGQISFVAGVVSVTLAAVLGLSACGSGDSSSGSGAESVESTEVQLKTAPASGVTCIAVTGTYGNGTPTVKKYLTVAANASTSALTLGQLPLGSVRFTANAYGLACTDATVTGGTAQANWIADPVQLNLQAGVVSTLQMNFHKLNAVAASANFIDNIKSVTAGGFSTFVITTDGTLKYWGLVDGAFGTNPAVALTTTNFPISGPITAVSSSRNASACALKADGTVWCWGINSNGQLGNGTNVDSVNTPVKVTGLANISSVGVGRFHACAASEKLGKVWCWGYNGYGQLGNSTTASSSLPVEVSYMGYNVRPRKLAITDYSSCVLQDSGQTYCWGNNDYGQLGIGQTASYDFPVQVGIDRNIKDIAAGGIHVCYVKTNNSLWCWGGNYVGQIGNGTTTAASTPVLVLNNTATVTAGAQHTCALQNDGSVYCWGFNGDGELGNGASTNALSPTPVPNLFGALSISSTNNHNCAWLGDLNVACWGANDYGQLGTGDYVNAYTPIYVPLQ